MKSRRLPKFGADCDAATAAAIADAADPQAADIRHEMFMHRPGTVSSWSRLGKDDRNKLCSANSIPETSLFKLIECSGGGLRLKTPLEDGGGVATRVLAAEPFMRVDVQAASPYNSVLEVLDALAGATRAGVQSFSVQTPLEVSSPNLVLCRLLAIHARAVTAALMMPAQPVPSEPE